MLLTSGAICVSAVFDEPARLEARVEADDTKPSDMGVGVGVGDAVGVGVGEGVGVGVEPGVEAGGSILAMKRSYRPLFPQFEVKAMKRPSRLLVGFGIAQYPVVSEKLSMCER